jgi:hypothetical protein
MKELTYEEILALIGENLDSTTFTWDNYCGTLGVSSIAIFDSDDSLVNNRFSILGWCYADKLITRWKPKGIAIKLWDQDEKQEVWCHISDIFLDTLKHKQELFGKKRNFNPFN